MQNTGVLLGFLALAAFIVLVGVIAARVRRKNREAWQLFCQRHGLTFAEQFNASGNIEGLEFKARGFWEKVGTANMPKMVMTVVVPGMADVSIGGRGFFSKAVGGKTHSEVVTGDAAFDRKALLMGSDGAAIKAYFTPERKAAALRMLEFGAVMQTGTILISQASIDTNVEKLSKKFTALIAFAKGLR